MVDISHINSLLQHLLKEAKLTKVPPLEISQARLTQNVKFSRVPAAVKSQITDILSDLEMLGLKPNAETYSLLILAFRDSYTLNPIPNSHKLNPDLEAEISFVDPKTNEKVVPTHYYESVAETYFKKIVENDYNLTIDACNTMMMVRGNLIPFDPSNVVDAQSIIVNPYFPLLPTTKRRIFEIINTVPKAKYNILTYELLLTLFGPILKDEHFTQKTFSKLIAISDLKSSNRIPSDSKFESGNMMRVVPNEKLRIRNDTIAIAVNAFSPFKDDSNINMLMHHAKEKKLRPNRKYLHGIMNFLITSEQYFAGLKAYVTLTLKGKSVVPNLETLKIVLRVLEGLVGEFESQIDQKDSKYGVAMKMQTSDRENEKNTLGLEIQTPAQFEVYLVLRNHLIFSLLKFLGLSNRHDSARLKLSECYFGREEDPVSSTNDGINLNIIDFTKFTTFASEALPAHMKSLELTQFQVLLLSEMILKLMSKLCVHPSEIFDFLNLIRFGVVHKFHGPDLAMTESSNKPCVITESMIAEMLYVCGRSLEEELVLEVGRAAFSEFKDSFERSEIREYGIERENDAPAPEKYRKMYMGLMNGWLDSKGDLAKMERTLKNLREFEPTLDN
ncbi:hypothetical protein HK098_004978 [Nowakowskiella sp. JEL0407]|nr:hypothetical protein HK098_004978 [Nowakowskiella sp. JEL0407]